MRNTANAKPVRNKESLSKTPTQTPETVKKLKPSEANRLKLDPILHFCFCENRCGLSAFAVLSSLPRGPLGKALMYKAIRGREVFTPSPPGDIRIDSSLQQVRTGWVGED